MELSDAGKSLTWSAWTGMGGVDLPDRIKATVVKRIKVTTDQWGDKTLNDLFVVPRVQRAVRLIARSAIMMQKNDLVAVTENAK